MDISFIADWFNGVTPFFNDLWEFFNSGIYQFFKDALVVVTKALIYAALQAKIMCINVGYEVISEIVQESGLAALVKSAWGSIPGNVQGTLAFFKVPQGLTLIFSAIPTRWAMKFVPGIGS